MAGTIASGPEINFPALCLFAVSVFIAALLPAAQALSAPIQRTITIDGNMADWKNDPTGNITTNPGQFSIDGRNSASSVPPDLDYPIQATGRDLRRFSFTYDSNNLYLWIERDASASNRTDWWFYLDTGNDGQMDSGDKVLRIEWRGNNGATTVRLYDYIEASSGGDDMMCPALGTNSVADGWCPVAGVADGYDMPGTLGVEHTLLASNGDAQNLSGGSTSGSSKGLEMETRISWAALGFSGPASMGFHIASSNGSNIPNQINDNMDGPGGAGGSFSFAELAVTISASVTSIVGGGSFNYTITVTNNGDTDATNVSLEDILPAGIGYVSHTASAATTYNPSTGLWSIGSVANLDSKILTISVLADPVTADTVVGNTANNLQLDQADPDTGNNQDSVDVTIRALPDIVILKSAQTIDDPVNGSTNPKAIPGASVLYTITTTNQGPGTADANTVIINDPIPANTELFVGDLDAGSPVAFIDGSPGSALVMNFTSLASTTDDIEFSSDGGISYNYTPVPDADDFDASITHIRITPSGTFAASDGTNHPGFTIRFKVRVQ